MRSDQVEYHDDTKQINDVEPILRELMCGNEDATQLMLLLYKLSQVWDDVHDQDKARSPKDVGDALRMSLIDIKLNEFYKRHEEEMNTLMLNSYLQWHDANILERSPVVEDKLKAYSLRVSWHQIIAYCSYIIGGPKYYEEAGPKIRRLYDESVVSFLQEMGVSA